MTNEEFQRYLGDRYQDQLDWYDRKARGNKRIFYFFQGATIILTGAASILGAIGGDWQKWSAVVMSAFVAVGTSFMLAFRNQELWLRYRNICETMKKEQYYYQARIGEYETHTEPMRLFVERVEALISPGNTISRPSNHHKG